MNYKKIYSDLHFREMLKGGSVSLLFKIISAFSSYYFMICLARLYGPVGVGVFSTAWIFLLVASVIGKLGFDTSIVRFIAESVSKRAYRNMRRTYVTCLIIILTSASIISIITIALAPFFTKHFFTLFMDQRAVMLVGISIIPFCLMSYNSESLKGMKRIFSHSVFQVGGVYFILIPVLYLVSFFDESPLASLISLFIVVVILMVVSFFVLRYYFSFYPKRNSFYAPPLYSKNQIVKKTMPMLLTNSLFLIMSWTDILMIANIQNETSVGIYNIALKVGALNSLVLISLNTIAMPKYAELYSSNKRRFQQVVKGVSSASFILTLPFFLFVVFFPDLILSLFGEQFVEGKYALIILSFGQMFVSFSGGASNLLNMVGREKVTFYVMTISFLLNFFLNLFLIPIYGFVGASVSTCISTVLMNLMFSLSVKYYLGFFPFPFFSLKGLKRY